MSQDVSGLLNRSIHFPNTLIPAIIFDELANFITPVMNVDRASVANHVYHAEARGSVVLSNKSPKFAASIIGRQDVRMALCILFGLSQQEATKQCAATTHWYKPNT